MFAPPVRPALIVQPAPLMPRMRRMANIGWLAGFDCEGYDENNERETSVLAGCRSIIPLC
jgi:hypothetical protein